MIKKSTSPGEILAMHHASINQQAADAAAAVLTIHSRVNESRQPHSSGWVEGPVRRAYERKIGGFTTLSAIIKPELWKPGETGLRTVTASFRGGKPYGVRLTAGEYSEDLQLANRFRGELSPDNSPYYGPVGVHDSTGINLADFGLPDTRGIADDEVDIPELITAIDRRTEAAQTIVGLINLTNDRLQS